MQPTTPPPTSPASGASGRSDAWSDKSTTSLVCGITGLVFSILPFAWLIGWILCLVGIRQGTDRRSRAGMICGIVGLVITFIQLFYVLLLFSG